MTCSEEVTNAMDVQAQRHITQHHTKHLARRGLRARIALCACLVFAMMLARVAPSDASTWVADDPDVARVLALAAENSPVIKGAAERVEQARADLRSARSKFGPSVSVGVGALWNKDALLLPVIDGRTGALAGAATLAWCNTYAAAAAFSQVLYAGGSMTANLRASQFALSAAEAEALRTYQSVMAGVRACCFGARRASARLRVAEEALDLSREHLRRAEALNRAGLVPTGDVLRVKVAVSEAEMNRIRAENAFDMALVELERLVCAPVERDVFATTEVDAGAARVVASDGAEEMAMANRPELAACDMQRQRAEQIVRAAAGERLPSVVLSGQYIAYEDDFFPTANDAWHVELGLQWNVFDSGETRSREQKAAAAARELLHRMDDLRAQIRSEVVRAELSLRSAESRLAVARDQVATAEEDHRTALRRYDARVGTNIDVLDSRVALTDSRTALVDAFYDMEAARSDLIFATGADRPAQPAPKEQTEE